MYLGSQTLTAAATTGVGFDNTLFSAPTGSFITTTVTFNGSTSEFSQCRVVTPGVTVSNVTTGVAVSPATMLAGGLATATVTFTNTSGAAVNLTSFTATLPPGFSLVRNSTTVGGVSTTEPTSSEPAALGGSLVWPRSGGNPPPQWPLQLPAGGSRVITFGLSAPATPVGPAALTVGGTATGSSVSPSSTDISAAASVVNSLVVPASEDTWVNEGDTDANYGADPTFDVQGGNGTPNSRRRALLKFDLSAIPAGTTVTGAKLRVGTIGGFSYDGDINHHALAIPDGWSEGTVTWLTRPADGVGTVACAFAATGCDDSSVLAETNPDYLGKDDVFYGGPYGVFDHLHTIPRPPETGTLASRLALRVQSERSLPGAALSIEIINPCCGPPDEGYLANYVSSENATRPELRPALVLTLTAGGGGGSTVVTTTADAGAGSLRQAILNANAQAGAQTISFNISVPEVGPKVIALQTSLPDITGPVTIDGTTQPGYVAAPNTPPLIVLDGSVAGVVGNGLTVAAGGNGSVIRALSITNFSPAPAAAIDVGAADVVVDRSYIGVRPNGTTVGANGVGIRVLGPDAVIGANTGIGLGNLIVASQVAGVELESNDAQVVGNIISAVTGVAGSGNAVGIFNDGATGSVITANGITSSTTGDGVVLGGASAGVDILNNGISANAGLGIDTRNDGVTENDPPGPVDHENFPTVVSATPNGPNLDVVVQFLARGRLPAESYRLELFRNTACDPSGNGEGEQRLGTASVTTNVDGFATSTFVVPGTTTGALTATATPLAAGNNRSTSEFSDCLVIGGGGGNLVLDAVQASVPSTGRVPLASIPGSALVARPAGSTEASPIRDIPIRDIPIRDIPIRDIPIADIPIRDIGFADGNVLPLLSSFSLSDIPLLRPGGWPAALATSTLATAPPQNVTLRDVLALNLPGLANLSLADLDLSRTALGQVPAAAVVLGAVPLAQLELPGGADWCQLAGPGVTCSPSSNVLAISIQGAPIADIPIADIPIRDIPIADIPIADIPIRDIPIADIPIRDIPIADIPIADIDQPHEHRQLQRRPELPDDGDAVRRFHVRDHDAELGVRGRRDAGRPAPRAAVAERRDARRRAGLALLQHGRRRLGAHRPRDGRAPGGGRRSQRDRLERRRPAVRLCDRRDRRPPEGVDLRPERHADRPRAAGGRAHQPPGTRHRHRPDREGDSRVGARRRARIDVADRVPDVPAVPRGTAVGDGGGDGGRPCRDLGSGADLGDRDLRAERRREPAHAG